jgi:hypothetical protein
MCVFLPPVFVVGFAPFFARFGTHDLHVYTGLVGLDAPFWTVFRRVWTRSFRSRWSPNNSLGWTSDACLEARKSPESKDIKGALVNVPEFGLDGF